MFQFKLDMGHGTIRLSISRSTEEWDVPWNCENHDHAEFELHTMLAGSCALEVEDKILQVCPGDAVLLPPGCFHRAVSTKGSQEHMVVLFTAEGPLEEILQDRVRECRKYPLERELLALCKKVRCELENGGQFCGTAMQNLLSLIMVYHLRMLELPQNEGNIPNSVEIGKKETKEIDSYFAMELSTARMEDLAARLHMSKAQVNRLLKKHYGVTFREKLIRAKMVRAAWLLTHTDLRVEEVAVTLGYRSLSAFHEMFRGRFDTTPERYRIISQNNIKGTADI